MTHSPTHPPSPECELTSRANLRVREHPLHQSSERSLVEWLGEHVRQHIFRGDVLEHDIAVFDVFFDKAVSDEDVLGPAEATASIGLHVHSRLVVLPRLDRAGIAVAEIAQQTCEPQRIADAVRESIHLRLSRGQRHCLELAATAENDS